MDIEIINESIDLEKNVAELYRLFHELFPVDRDFWWTLYNEELNHASILKVCLDFIRTGLGCEDMIYPDIHELKYLNSELVRKRREYAETPPDKKTAYRYAIHIESMAYEMHYNDVMNNEYPSEVVEVFKKLNGDDKDHAERIQKLLDSLS